MARNDTVTRVVFLTSALAAFIVIAAVVFFPPPLNRKWLIAYGTFLALALFSGRFALERTEGGTRTSLNFVAELGALLVTGPTGAITLTCISHLTSQFVFYDKKPVKAFYNTAQTVLSVALAGLGFVLLGGEPHLEHFDLNAVVLPFLGAVGLYFTFNSFAVSYIVSLSEGVSLREVLRRLAGGAGIILLDAAMSCLALLVAFLYLEWGPTVLLLAVIPIIGLRYTYGTNIELEQLNADLLRVLIKALEAQDPYTSGHSVRVAERSKLIAEELGLPHKQIRNVEIAALLHDIGKIDVAYHDILKQEGPLTEEQRELIREHPERGVDIVRSVRSLDQEVLEFIRHHHERIDGNGYPEGIEKDEIPLGARIIMVSDTIDAMLTKRPYRDALPLSVVREELKTQSGTQFDSEVVRAAFSIGILDEDFNQRLEAGSKLIEISRH